MNQPLDRLLAAYCSPTLAGIKPASLVSCSRAEHPDLPRQLQEYRQAFAARGIRFDILCACRGRFLLLVYHRERLAAHMAEGRVQRVLRSFGYPDGAPLETLLDGLRRRIAVQQDFPHEIGLFLGYPIEDVVGFIRHAGRGCKLCGYWKVYTDVEAAKRCFATFDACRDAFERALRAGKTVTQLLEMQQMRTA